MLRVNNITGNKLILLNYRITSSPSTHLLNNKIRKKSMTATANKIITNKNVNIIVKLNYKIWKILNYANKRLLLIF